MDDHRTRAGNVMFEALSRGDHEPRRWWLLNAACIRMVRDLGDTGARFAACLEAMAEDLPIPDEGLTIPPGLEQNLHELLSRARSSGHAGRVLWRTGIALGHDNMDYDPFLPHMHCIFGDAPHPRPPWSASIVALAGSCRAAWPAVDASYAVLGDALEMLGEPIAAAHCRAAVHVRGCHVIEAILGVERRLVTS